MSVTAKVVSKFFMMASIRRVLVRLKISNSHCRIPACVLHCCLQPHCHSKKKGAHLLCEHCLGLLNIILPQLSETNVVQSNFWKYLWHGLVWTLEFKHALPMVWMCFGKCGCSLFPFYTAGRFIIGLQYSWVLAKLFGDRSVPVLTTLLFLSYTKLLDTIITALLHCFLFTWTTNI